MTVPRDTFVMAEPPEKRSRQLVLTSDCESEHSEEQSQGSSSGSAGTHKRRQFLQHWLKIYPWLTWKVQVRTLPCIVVIVKGQN